MCPSSSRVPKNRSSLPFQRGYRAGCGCGGRRARAPAHAAAGRSRPARAATHAIDPDATPSVRRDIDARRRSGRRGTARCRPGTQRRPRAIRRADQRAGETADLAQKHGDVDWRPRRADVSVTPSSSGRQLGQANVIAALTAAVRQARHRVQLAFERRQPRVSTRAARGIRALIGTFTTRYGCRQPRVTNIRLIAKAVDRTVVMPGEPFSLNQVSGERTRAGGYVKAPFIADGELAESIGGGVSQVSTTLYNAVYFAGLQTDAHRPHCFYIDRYPPGPRSNAELSRHRPALDLRHAGACAHPGLNQRDVDCGQPLRRRHRPTLTRAERSTHSCRRQGVRDRSDPRAALPRREGRRPALHHNVRPSSSTGLNAGLPYAL